MKVIILAISVFFTGLSYAKEDCSIPQGTKTGNPVVEVAPRVSNKIPVSSCVVVSFMLKEKPGTEGKVLIPTSIDIETSTNKKLGRSVKKAVSKWLYFAKSHSTAIRYYYSYKLQPE